MALLLGLSGAAGFVQSPAAAQETQDEDEDFGYASYLDEETGIEIPGDLGQAELQVWYRDTGHTLRGYMLDYWRSQGATSVFGLPISEPFASENGYYSQAFERGIFQFRPEFIWNDSPTMTLMPVGDELLESRVGTTRRDGRRTGGGGDPRTSAWRTYGPESSVAGRALEQGGIYSELTGHSITGEFLSWYNDHEGSWYLGAPVSQPVAERGLVVQYFEGGILLRSKGGRVWLAPVIREQPQTVKVDTTPVKRNGVREFRGEADLWTAGNPNPMGDPEAPGRKWLDVNLTTQSLSVYQGSTLVSSTLVSTGLAPNFTSEGIHHIRLKYPKQDMAGVTGANGEVVAVGDGAVEAVQPGQAPYEVEDVPDVMYINMEGEALHGAYWHNNFGNPMSHGCINLPLDFAKFLYGWAPLGTMVWVHK